MVIKTDSNGKRHYIRKQVTSRSQSPPLSRYVMPVDRNFQFYKCFHKILKKTYCLIQCIFKKRVIQSINKGKSSINGSCFRPTYMYNCT